MNPETRDKLMDVSVATLATALFKRGLRNQVIQGVHPVAPKGRNMVGPAFTLRYMPAREDRNQLGEFRNPAHPQRVAIETCPAGHILVIDARKDARAASSGDILITRLMVRGGAGMYRYHEPQSIYSGLLNLGQGINEHVYLDREPLRKIRFVSAGIVTSWKQLLLDIIYLYYSYCGAESTNWRALVLDSVR